MLIKTASHPGDCLPSEITSRELFERRRDFLKYSIGAGLGLMLPWAAAEEAARTKFAGLRQSPFSIDEKANKYEQITTYNNFYEFGTDKAEPAQNAHKLHLKPWTVSIEGMVKKPKTLGLDEILKLAPLEERIYRLRCVEGWSMVIPWVGYSLSAILNQVEPLGSAKYVEFVSAYQSDVMEGGGFGSTLDWPYVEGLRLDEARHPLTLLGLGLYGETLPNQNGAPVRVVVPWKYGFKSAKSIVKIRFVEKEPQSSWMKAAGSEYGFYSNVNPEVDHPRWSQANERRIGDFLKRKTLMFNGYRDLVAGMYKGMDLRKFY